MDLPVEMSDKIVCRNRGKQHPESSATKAQHETCLPATHVPELIPVAQRCASLCLRDGTFCVLFLSRRRYALLRCLGMESPAERAQTEGASTAGSGDEALDSGLRRLGVGWTAVALQAAAAAPPLFWLEGWLVPWARRQLIERLYDLQGLRCEDEALGVLVERSRARGTSWGVGLGARRLSRAAGRSVMALAVARSLLLSLVEVLALDEFARMRRENGRTHPLSVSEARALNRVLDGLVRRALVPLADMGRDRLHRTLRQLAVALKQRLRRSSASVDAPAERAAPDWLSELRRWLREEFRSSGLLDQHSGTAK